MYQVILFFPDIRTLTAFSAQLYSGPVEINSVHLTVKVRLEIDQILDAMLLYEATPCCADNWEILEQWMDACKKIPYRSLYRYARSSITTNENRLADWPVLYLRSMPKRTDNDEHT